MRAIQGARGAPPTTGDHRAPCPSPRAPAGAEANTGKKRQPRTEARVREAEEDRALIALAKNGDGSAFRSLVLRHQRRAFVIAVGLVRDEHDAHEIVQEAFLRVYRGLGAFEGTSTFFTWLYRIVSNLSIDLLRRPGRRESVVVDLDVLDESPEPQFATRIDGSDPLDVVRRGEIRQRIQEALDELPAYHRGVIVMREVEGMSYEEMAEAMGVSKGTIMSRLFHARRKLQFALAECYEQQLGAVPKSSGCPTRLLV